MKKAFFCAACSLLLAATFFFACKTLASPSPAPATPQDSASRCIANVPLDWGEYVDSSTNGVAFRDQSGTLRFVKNFPCGLEGAPNVALEIRRK